MHELAGLINLVIFSFSYFAIKPWIILGVLASRRLVDLVISCLGRIVRYHSFLFVLQMTLRFTNISTDLREFCVTITIIIFKMNGTKNYSIAFCADSDIHVLALDGFG